MFFVRVIRIIVSIPIIIGIETIKIYNFFLSIIDYKNHNSFFEEYLQKILDKKVSKKIFIDKKKFIQFHNPTKSSAYRAKTFFDKEPETIDWMIKRGKKNKILFDVGANMGVYSIFYAKKFNSKVFAFEPSLRNLDLLTRNISLNNLNKKIIVFSNPLNKEDKISEFYQFDLRGGNAGATFNSKNTERRIRKNQDNKETKNSSFQTYGIGLNSLITKKILPLPDLIKIDVDGNEYEILKGLEQIFSKVKKLSLLIEIRKNTEKKISSLLKKNRFKLVLKKDGNQIWER